MSGQSILIVEDEGLIALDIERALSAFGYRVVGQAAASADEALQAVAEFAPELVLMDIRLEDGLDGIRAAELIRARYRIPIVYLTSHSDALTMARAQATDPYGYVLKPFTDQQLAAVLEIAFRRRAVEARLAEKTALLEAVLGSMEDAVIAADTSDRVLLYNAAASDVLGKNPSVSPFSSATGPGLFLADGETRCPYEQTPMQRALRGETVRNAEFFARTAAHPDGRWRSVNATPLRGPDGVVRGAVTVGRDVTDLKTLESWLRQLSFTDPLTGAYNRRGFLQLAEREMQSAARTGVRSQLLFVDLNGMKGINDTLGHQEGDRALIDASSVLKNCFSDGEVVARLGGDEFAVLAPESGEFDENALRERVQAAVDAFNTVSERPYRLSMSVGVCTYDPGTAASVETLVEEADQRMYEEKQRRRESRGAPESKAK